MQDPNLILEILRKSKFIVARRSKGLICPLSMRIVGFEDMIKSLRVWRWAANRISHWSSAYLINDLGGTKNVHREIRKLLKAGLLEIHNGTSIRVKE